MWKSERNDSIRIDELVDKVKQFVVGDAESTASLIKYLEQTKIPETKEEVHELCHDVWQKVIGQPEVQNWDGKDTKNDLGLMNMCCPHLPKANRAECANVRAMMSSCNGHGGRA